MRPHLEIKWIAMIHGCHVVSRHVADPVSSSAGSDLTIKYTEFPGPKHMHVSPTLLTRFTNGWAWFEKVFSTLPHAKRWTLYRDKAMFDASTAGLAVAKKLVIVDDAELDANSGGVPGMYHGYTHVFTVDQFEKKFARVDLPNSYTGARRGHTLGLPSARRS